MQQGLLGQMCTPAEGRTPLPGVPWAADNGCFGKGYPGDEKWIAWLGKHASNRDRCLFAVAPDVVGNAVDTLARSKPWLPRIRSLGYRAAFVAQNGLTPDMTPWPELDVLFIGGSTDWKLGEEAANLVHTAVSLGKPVHMGRVNSAKRYRYAKSIGCVSADGTFLAFGPDTNLVRLRAWST